MEKITRFIIGLLRKVDCYRYREQFQELIGCPACKHFLLSISTMICVLAN